MHPSTRNKPSARSDRTTRAGRASRVAAVSAVAASLAFSAACGSALPRASGLSALPLGAPPSTARASERAAAPAKVTSRSTTGTAAASASGASPASASLSVPAAAAVAPVSAPVARCRTTALSARVGTGDAGAGQRYAPLVLTNTGTRTCWVYGFVGLIMIDGNGDALRTRTRREAVRPGRVTLRPGAGAHARLHWTVVPTGKERTCPRSARLMIIPPDEVAHLEIPFDATVCADGRIDVRPMQPGTGL
ncbi:DUF4232 domain-containing protein [Microtetraspora niveoalba]|uniref:DUF4232 domain-containing protein n=1 Tax=Microtetraspora niveoalba TaxID=46175 RepID=UPI000833A3D4|nr:DUF4232 domain-containing protein [Microtetraspora niveoalba]